MVMLVSTFILVLAPLCYWRIAPPQRSNKLHVPLVYRWQVRYNEVRRLHRQYITAPLAKR